MRDSALTDHDIYLFKEGRHFQLTEMLGSHPEPGGGTRFAVWAPTADYVSVIGDFNSTGNGASAIIHTVPSAGLTIAASSCGGTRSGSRKNRYTATGTNHSVNPIHGDTHPSTRCSNTTIIALITTNFTPSG